MTDWDCARARDKDQWHWEEGCKSEEGWAGRLFRLMLEEQKLFVASGHTHETITHLSPQGHTKTIDYVIIPRSCAESITRATALYASGNRAPCQSETATGSRPRLSPIRVRTRPLQAQNPQHTRVGCGPPSWPRCKNRLSKKRVCSKD